MTTSTVTPARVPMRPLRREVPGWPTTTARRPRESGWRSGRRGRRGPGTRRALLVRPGECLELLGCYGSGRVHKFAEIVAATVLCGEISLGAAVVAGEWVTAHEQLGRNRP